MEIQHFGASEWAALPVRDTQQVLALYLQDMPDITGGTIGDPDDEQAFLDGYGRWLDGYLTDASAEVVVASVAGVPVCAARLAHQDERHPPEDFIDALQTSPGHRRQGLARALLVHLASDEGHRELVAEVHVRNIASQRAFAAAGFVNHGEVPGVTEDHMELWVSAPPATRTAR